MLARELPGHDDLTGHPGDQRSQAVHALPLAATVFAAPAPAAGILVGRGSSLRYCLLFSCACQLGTES